MNKSFLTNPKTIKLFSELKNLNDFGEKLNKKRELEKWFIFYTEIILNKPLEN
jgi:hypothetical protein